MHVTAEIDRRYRKLITYSFKMSKKKNNITISIPRQSYPSQPGLQVHFPSTWSHLKEQPALQISSHVSPYQPSMQLVQTPEVFVHPPSQVLLHVFSQCVPNLPTGHVPSHSPESLRHPSRQPEQMLLQKSP